MRKILSNFIILYTKINFMQRLLLFVGLLCFFQAALAQDLSMYEKKMFISGNDTLRYRILYPQNFTKSKAWPLIVFLHGAGERGNDNELQLMHGGDLFLKEEVRKEFPAIVIFPQCPPDSACSRFKRNTDSSTKAISRVFMADQSPTTPQRLVKSLIDSIVQSDLADKKRIYLGGLSLGGFGTYDLLIRYPDFFAAAFPICGACNTQLFVQRASQVPLWIFHGALDDVVSAEPDRALYKALQQSGAKEAKYTEYPNANHNSWDSAFAEPELLSWLFSKHK